MSAEEHKALNRRAMEEGLNQQNLALIEEHTAADQDFSPFYRACIKSKTSLRSNGGASRWREDHPVITALFWWAESLVKAMQNAWYIPCTDLRPTRGQVVSACLSCCIGGTVPWVHSCKEHR